MLSKLWCIGCAKIVALLLLSSAFFCLNPAVAGLLEKAQVSGGADARGFWKEYEKPDAELYGVFLNYRKIFADDLGDRWILSLQGDAEHNFKEIKSYQSFLQYKGPLGKWNIRAGHFILPFGLLNDFDSERMLLQSQEADTIGLKLDTGVSLFGFVDDWNWTLSLTSGLGRRWISDYKNTYLTTARVSRKFEDLTIGTSLLIGESAPVETFTIQDYKIRRQLLAIDGLYEFDQWTTRFQFLYGKEQANHIGGIEGFLDYQISNFWELNFKGSSIFRDEKNQEFGIGAGFKLWEGWIFRAADIYQFKGESNENEFKIQMAYQFLLGI